MIKISKQKTLSITILLTLLLVSTASAALIPKAQAAEPTIQQKGLTVLNNVVGIDLTKYNVTTREYPEDVKASYMGVVPQRSVEYTLTSGESKLKMFYTFANGNLQMIQVLENEGTPKSTKPPAIANIQAARSFLSKYQISNGDPLYGELQSTLNGLDPRINQTKTSGNMHLETATIDGYTNFKWYYTSNGAIAPYSKFITLSFEDGFLSAFVNNWQLYGIGSTSVNLTKEEALNIALETAKVHSWGVALDADTLDVKNFNESNVCWTALIFDGSLNVNTTRSEDPLMLYPVWRVGIALDKWYGNMYGIEVDVWADTGEVRSVEEAWGTMTPSDYALVADDRINRFETNASLSMFIPLSLVGVAVAGVFFISASKRKPSQPLNLLKPFYRRPLSLFLCVILGSTVFFTSIATVNATTRGAVVWGSQSDSAINPGPTHWRKSQTEIDNQSAIADNIKDYFGNAGYNAYDHQGNKTPGSTKGQIESDIINLQYYNDYAAVVDFDHGVGGYPPYAPPYEMHYMFEDNNGTIFGTQQEYNESPENHTDWNHGVFDMEIYNITNPDKFIFAFISTCMSADTTYFGQGLIDTQWNPNPRALGMPLAWTHRFVENKSTPGFNIAQNISNDGYDHPDWGYQVYIGFPYGSPSLSQRIPYNTGNLYCYWVDSFFYNALGYMSVNDALNTASFIYLGYIFRICPLRTGFTSHWDGPFTDYPDCTMAIYGNGNIYLKQFTPPTDTPIQPIVSGPTAGDVDTSYEFTAFAGDPYGHDVKYRFDWGDGSNYEETDWCSDGVSATASHSWSSGAYYNVKVQSRCPNSGWSSWSTAVVINIGNQPVYHTLMLWAFDSFYWYDLNPDVYVDSTFVGTAPVYVQVLEGEHTVTVDESTYNPFTTWTQYLTGFSDALGNGDTRYVYSYYDVYAYYY